MRKIGRKTVRQFSEKGWPTRGGFLYNMNTYLIHTLEIGAPGGVASLRHRNPPKSPFLCVNGSPILYGLVAAPKLSDMV